MKITEIKALATKPPDATRNYVFVKVSTDQGLVGWGESTMGAVSVGNVIEEIGQTLVGKDPFRIEQHWQSLYHLYHNVRGGVFQMAAISGIEIALWDIKSKALGVPVYELLGGAMRDRIWAYGRFDGDTPELAAEHARAEVDQGFSALKGDPFAHSGLFTTPEVERDAIAKVQAVREEVGQDVELMVEAHGRLTVSEAIRLGHALEAYRPFWFEEAVPPENVDAMAKVASAINIPLATGERLYTKWGFRDLLEKQVVSVVQPDICHAGGILELRHIAAMAETYYVGFAPHNPYGPVNTMASIQVDACTPNFLIQEGGHRAWFDYILKEPFTRQREGYFDLPTASGIGVELDEDALLRYPHDPNTVQEGYGQRRRLPSRQQNLWP
jgi:galactonate dehydratase